MRAHHLLRTFFFSATLLAACGPADDGESGAELADGRDDVAFVPGKADSEHRPCELEQILHLVNDPATSFEVLHAAGVHTRAARNIVKARDGADGVAGTADDEFFADLAALDAVYYVGPVALRQLVAAVQGRCPEPGAAWAEVIVSPKPYEQSHLARIAELVRGAQRSIDIAMYSFSDNGIMDALAHAIERGVTVRLVFEPAGEHRRDPAGTTSARLEEMGVDVRWVNKIMHHKFAIIDGPRDSIDQATKGLLVSGSGNWSHSAGTRYDENTVIIGGHPEALLRFQREFNHLWANSRPLDWNPDLTYFESMAIDDAQIESAGDDPGFDVAFTSANFRTYESRYGRTFTRERGRNTVADRLVALIKSATKSIHIASGHLRSRPIAEALMAKHAEMPDLDIRVYLDGQEYISETTSRYETRDLATCLESAGDSEPKREDCETRGFHFSYPVYATGIPVRFKHYAYRWDYTYAPQMHHKYLLIDGRILATGSYNFSDNAEHNTLENCAIFDAASFPEVVATFEETFESMWVTGEADGLLDQLLDEIQDPDASSIPIVYPAMALSWDDVTELKRAIRAACPAVSSTDYRRNAAAHRYCER